ncbi:MAG: hypothetical protein J2O47_03290, partial [Acidimicrobiaceae bacterium]|nr:hypothetical protein [Acidimicrobiaceae bacterium]
MTRFEPALAAICGIAFAAYLRFSLRGKAMSALAMLLMVVAFALVGALLGFYITRVPGFALALATLFFSVIVVGFVQYNSYLGAQTGLGPVPYVITGSSYTRSLEYSGTAAAVANTQGAGRG